MKITSALVLAITALAAGNLAAQSKPNAKAAPADPGWPRQRTNEQGSLVYYQPQVDAWKNFKELDFRMAFSLTPKVRERDRRHHRGAGADGREC